MYLNTSYDLPSSSDRYMAPRVSSDNFIAADVSAKTADH